MLHYATKVSIDTGIRTACLRKTKWKHITENTAIPKEERKIWLPVNLPPENTRTGRYYTISAPIAKHLERLPKVTGFNIKDDFLFVNQGTGQSFSDRIRKDALCEILVEARLAHWAEDDSNNLRKVEIHSGKSLTWHSYCHTQITMRLNAGVPVVTAATNTDISMKYIEGHYFHYRTSEATEILPKGRRFRASMQEPKWVDAVEESPKGPQWDEGQERSHQDCTVAKEERIYQMSQRLEFLNQTRTADKPLINIKNNRNTAESSAAKQVQATLLAYHQ